MQQMKKTAIILAALLCSVGFRRHACRNSDSKDTFFRKLNTFNSVVRELQTAMWTQSTPKNSWTTQSA